MNKYLYILITILILTSWFGLPLIVLATTEIFATSTTWVAPSGVTSVDVEAWGGGGAGIGDSGSSSNRKTGGGGGAYAKKSGISVTPGNSYTVTVGIGGVGTQDFNAAASGTASWFLSTSTVYAAPGEGGKVSGSTVATSLGGQASSSIGDVVFSGGDSPGHNNAFDGMGGGGGAGDSADGSDGGTTNGGAGGATGGGDGGGESDTLSVQDGKELAGGGGDRFSSTGRGGHGFRGEVRITYTASTSSSPSPIISTSQTAGSMSITSGSYTIQ